MPSAHRGEALVRSLVWVPGPVWVTAVRAGPPAQPWLRAVPDPARTAARQHKPQTGAADRAVGLGPP